MPITTCIFDAYGTLFDVAAAARNAASEPGREKFARHWPTIAEHWRLKQLQYTWLRAVTGDHTDFWRVTQDGLDWALEAQGLAGDTSLRDRLLQKTVKNRRHSKHAFAPIRLRDIHPPHRLRNISPRQHIGFHRCPVLA